ncbi:MAG: SRPBCC family protein [Bacteroidia bacterium]|nr:SRPBCC family protein [Bacteroidia bacterium]
MKLFKVYLIVFLIVFLFFGISRFFPHTYYVERSIVINKPVETTFAFLSNYHNWEKWSLWDKNIDSTLIYFYNKKQDTLGARQYFNGDLLGKGYFETTLFKRNEVIQFKLSVNRDERTAAGTFSFIANENNTTELHWIDSGDVGNNPLKRYMIPYVTKNTSVTLDQGLERIKNEVEKLP